MILRKPYAFLIKHFRAIHLIITTLSILLTVYIGKIKNFFVDYIKLSSYLKIYIEPSMTSIKWYIFALIIIIIAMLSTIFTLMNKKNKPTKFYLIAIIYYFILFLDLVFSNSQIFSLVQYEGVLKTIVLTRGLIQILYYIQFGFIIVFLLRGIGFNIKKFDFKDDLREMNISEEDNEEFEFEVQFDSNDIKTKIRREIRIIKYIINENKKMVIALLSGILIFLFTKIGLNLFIYNKVYRENQKVKMNNFDIKVLESYETSFDYKQNDISSKNEYKYFILKTKISNITKTAKNIPLTNFYLKVDEYKSYQSSTKDYKKFSDIGIGYNEQKINAKEEKIYIFLFKVDKEYINNRKTFEILKSVTNEDGEIKYNFSKIKIDPIDLDNIKEKATASLNDNMIIDDNILGKFELNIENIELVNKIEYSYKDKINNKEYEFTSVIQPNYDNYYGKKILKLKANLKINETSNEELSKKLIGNFGHISYIKNGKKYNNPFKIVEKVPSEESEYKYIEVYDQIENADNIWLSIIIRNKEYKYKIK